MQINQDERELLEGRAEPRLGRCLVMLEYFRIWCRENPFTCGVTDCRSGAQLTEEEVYFAANSPNRDVMLSGGGVGAWLLSGFEEPRVEKAARDLDERLKARYLSQVSDYIHHNIASVAGGEPENEVEAGSTDPCFALLRCTRAGGIACRGQYPTMSALRDAYERMRAESSVFIESRAA